MFLKKLFLQISQNHMETPASESLSNKFVCLKPATLLKRDSGSSVSL